MSTQSAMTPTKGVGTWLRSHKTTGMEPVRGWHCDDSGATQAANWILCTHSTAYGLQLLYTLFDGRILGPLSLCQDPTQAWIRLNRSGNGDTSRQRMSIAREDNLQYLTQEQPERWTQHSCLNCAMEESQDTKS